MKPINPHAFDRKHAEAAAPIAAQDTPMIRVQMNRSDWLILGALSLIWGAAFFFISVVVHHVPTPTYVWLRLTIAAAGVGLYFLVTGRSLRLPSQVWASMAVLAALNNALPFMLIGWSETQIASGLASIINATTPIFGVLVAHFGTSDERITPTKMGGVVIGFAGVAVMLAPTLDLGSRNATLAIVACVIASLSYALAGVWARRFRRQGISAMSVTFGQLTAGAAIMLPIAMIADQPWRLPMPPLAAWGGIFALALMCSAFAYVLYFRLIERAGATNAMLVTLLVPVTAVILGAALLGERLGIADYAGMALIAVGLAAIDGRLLSRLRAPRPLPREA